VAGRSLHVFLILFALFGLFMLGLGVCVQEDAFISFRYASNLIQGHGLVYNVGERVEGYTNFLWTLILAGGMALGADPVPLSRFLGIGFALVVLPRTLEWVGDRAWDLKRRTAAGSMLAEYARAGDTLAIHSA